MKNDKQSKTWKGENCTINGPIFFDTIDDLLAHIIGKDKQEYRKDVLDENI